jgi:hypothetical protein
MVPGARIAPLALMNSPRPSCLMRLNGYCRRFRRSPRAWGVGLGVFRFLQYHAQIQSLTVLHFRRPGSCCLD